MFETGVERTILLTAIGLWIAHGWYLNSRLAAVHKKLDRILDNFGGLRDYLYEIDPQFDDERRSADALENDDLMFGGMNDMDLLRQKAQQGRRTLNTPFVER